MSDNPQQDGRLFDLLAQEQNETEEVRAPSRMKSRLYSALIRRQEESGPLRSLGETQAQGYGLCVFEDLWQRATSGEAAQCFNCCKLCHARVLAEHLEGAPIYWGNCPYVTFVKK
ncbi:MAG: hypothetical protein ACREQ5_17175 [Candidatus Dormibacteria bacterium]